MPVKIFFCYAHEDEALLNQLKSHLKPLQRQGLIDFWHDRDISAGTEWEREIKEHLDTAQIVLLLVSADFMNSEYCYSSEMKRALERDERKEARVIPIILRPVDWKDVLGRLQALPTDGTPVIDRRWHTSDEALYIVAQGIRKIVEELTLQLLYISSEADIQPVPPLDSDAVVKEAKELEKQFQANGYTGRSIGPSILEVKGTLPVVISAPHAVRCGRNVQKQIPQLYTGALALQLATLTGASALITARTSDEDPNRDEPGLYKPKLATLVSETGACFVLDMHGSDENFVKEKGLGQVEIGTADNASLRGALYFRQTLVRVLENAGITVTVDKYFTADRPGTITLYTSEKLGTPAMQLEITQSLRDPEHVPQKYVHLLSALRDAIVAMHDWCR